MDRVLPYLRLCRLPTVFTALADICAGFLLVHARPAPLSEWVLLLIASAGLYLSGMVFNDLCDIAQDTVERPHRPLPSGAVSPRAARRFGSLLMGTGVLAAALASWNSLGIALLLCLTILGYDRWLKRTPLGPVAMGSCRFFNLLLGASTAGTTWGEIWQWPQLWMAAAMGIYIAGVTWFARKEAAISRRSSLIGAAVTVNLGLLLLGAWWTGRLPEWGIAMPPPAEETMSLFAWAVVALTINRRLAAAIALPEPARIQPAIGIMLLSVIVIDAVAIFYQQGPQAAPYALGTLALLIPAVLLRRWIALT